MPHGYLFRIGNMTENQVQRCQDMITMILFICDANIDRSNF